MKRVLLFAALAPWVGLGREMTLGVGGRLALAEPAVEIEATFFDVNWRRPRHIGLEQPDAHGKATFELAIPAAEHVDAVAEAVPGERGTVRVSYFFTPRRDMELQGMCVDFSLPVSAMGGGTWRADGTAGRFAEKMGRIHFFSGKVRRLEMCWPGAEEPALKILFDKPTQVSMQDNRKWGSDSFSVRLGSAGRKVYAAGEPFRVAFTVASDRPIRLGYDRHVVLQAGAEWAEIKYEKEIEPGSALDFSSMGFADAPAGKHGWLKAVGPQFEFEAKPGAAQRFYGVNFCFTACFPSAEQAEKLAARLVRLGYNSVRIHHHDNGCVQGSKDGLTLNPDQMARLDGFLAECYKRGLYVTTDLFVSRPVQWRHIGIDREGQVGMQAFKALIAVHEPAFQNWAAFARAFLNHVNPHTGRRYADEPGMPLLAMINEGSIGYWWNREARDTPVMQAAWAAWLKERRSNDPDFAGVPENMSEVQGQSVSEEAALARFVADTEARMIARMKTFLRDEIGCRALISNYNCGPHHTTIQQVREELYDYVDDHFYVDHPQFIINKWQLPSRCGNSNPILQGCPVPCRTAFTRLTNKPFTVTEYNFSGPGMYRGVGGILTGAMGALQGWGGMWRFAYSHNVDNLFGDGNPGYFDLATDPLAQASERASLCMFLRGDIDQLEEGVAILLPPRGGAPLPDDQVRHVAPDWRKAAWLARVGTRVAGEAPPHERALPADEAYQSGDKLDAALDAATNRVQALSMDQERGSFTITTARTCGGFVEDGSFAAGPLAVTVRDTPATVWVSALDRETIGKSGRLLVTHLTDVQGAGRKFAEKARKTLLSWGGLPVLVRKGRAEVSVTLEQADKMTVYALATDGRRLGKVPASVKDGALSFTAATAGPHGTCMLYEIAR